LVDVIGVQTTVIGAGSVFLTLFVVLRFGTSMLSAMDGGSLETTDELNIASAGSAEAAVDPI
jgi:hypothetical protein